MRSRMRQMSRIGADAIHQQIAIDRRAANDLAYANVENDTTLCFNCNLSITKEAAAVETDRICLRLNIVNQTGNRACFLCGTVEGATRVSLQCRVDIFVKANCYVPEHVRVCAHHFEPNDCVIPALMPGLRYTNRPCSISAAQFMIFLKQLRNTANS